MSFDLPSLQWITFSLFFRAFSYVSRYLILRHLHLTSYRCLTMSSGQILGSVMGMDSVLTNSCRSAIGYNSSIAGWTLKLIFHLCSNSRKSSTVQFMVDKAIRSQVGSLYWKLMWLNDSPGPRLTWLCYIAVCYKLKWIAKYFMFNCE